MSISARARLDPNLGPSGIEPREAKRPRVLHDELVGVVLGGTYRVERKIDRGGLSDLYAASHLRLRRRYALKVLRPKHRDSDLCRARFEREARAMSRVRSAYVPQVVDLLETPDGRPCLVMEMLAGESLQHHLTARGRLSVTVAVRLARQVATALMDAHCQGVIHRDIKPSNVFLVRTGRGDLYAHVIDFGVAELQGAEEDPARGRVVGTPAYMSPEQAVGLPVDERVDVYGVGAVLYRMLTGQAPHSGVDIDEVLDRVRRGDSPSVESLRPGLHASVTAVVERAMAPDPAARFSSMKTLDEALEELQSVIAGRTGNTVRRLDRQSRYARARGILTMGAVSLWAAFIGAGVTSVIAPVQHRWVLAMAAASGLVTAAWGSLVLRRRWRSSWSMYSWRTRLYRLLSRTSLAFAAVLSLTVGLGALAGEPATPAFLLACLAATAVAVAKETPCPQE